MNTRISITGLVRKTGFSKNKILFLLKKMRRRYAFFSKVNWMKIGLVKLIIILDKPWPWDKIVYPDSVTNISESYEGKQVVSYLIPPSDAIAEILDSYKGFIRDYMVLDNILYPNYRFLKYFNNGRIEIDTALILEKTLEKEETITTNKTKKKHCCYRISELDVKILNKLFAKPLTPTKRIAEELGERYDKVRRHIDLLFKREIIEGYFVGGINIFGKLLFGLIIRIKLEDTNKTEALAWKLSNIPPFSIIYYNSKGDIIVNIPVYKKLLENLQKIPKIFKNKFNNNVDIYVMSLERKFKFDVDTKMYNKYIKTFILK